MDFTRVLPHVLAGGTARRTRWTGTDTWIVGSWIQLVTPSPGCPNLPPTIMIWNEHAQRFFIWGGIHVDILADDWELL